MKAPAAHRKVLVSIAGAVWLVVGAVLMIVAIRWTAPFHGYRLLCLAAGAIAGIMVFKYGFGRLAAANIERIFAQAPGKDKVCLFAFQNVRSYVIIIIMVGLGYTLRHLPISKLYLVPVYFAIGEGMALSSLSYYCRLRR